MLVDRVFKPKQPCIVHNSHTQLSNYGVKHFYTVICAKTTDAWYTLHNSHTQSASPLATYPSINDGVEHFVHCVLSLLPSISTGE